MTAYPSGDRGGLSVDAYARIDELCDRFESAWRAGNRPDPVAFVAEIEERARRQLLVALLALDLEFQVESGKRPDPAVYRAQFPDYLDVIDEVFTRVNVGPGEKPITTLPGSANAAAPTHAGHEGTMPWVGPGLEMIAALRNAGYEIDGELGQGGMGVVYLARKVALHRQCALKMILAGARAGSSALIRFRAEAEAVARIRHPDIVQIFHVGDVEGLPFIELEYLAGGSLDRKLDGTPWSAAAAAKLVEVVAHAMAEAHRRGVVHRDLKPANILLDLDGRPKVADFGLAKMLDSDAGVTKSQSVLGSPCYMSPEQAEGRSQEVGTQTDIYAIGAVLYELLTGRPPFRAATALETLALIKTADPVPPSRLQPGLKRDMETICLKCLDKVASRRYSGALELADDLARFRAGEPIHARPVPVWERTWRLAARAPAVAALILLILIVTATGFSLVFWQWRRAERARSVAVSNLEKAEANYAFARDAVDRYFTRISEDRLLNEPHMTTLRKDLLQTARGFYEEFVKRRAGDPNAQADLGTAYNRLGSIDRALMSADGMEANAKQAQKIFTALVAIQPDNPAYQQGLAESEIVYGASYRIRGQKMEALAAYDRATKLLEPLFARYPTEDVYLTSLGHSYFNAGITASEVGRYSQAVELLTKARDLWATRLTGRTDAKTVATFQSNIARCERVLDQVYFGAQRYKLAEETARRALRLFESLTAAYPESVEFRRMLSVVHSDLTVIYNFTGRRAESLHHRDEAIAAGEALVTSHPELAEVRESLAIHYLNAAIDAREEGRLDLIEARMSRALMLQRGLVAERPEVAQFRSELAHSETTLDIFHRDGGRPAEAEAAARRALELREKLVAEHPEVQEYRADLGFSLHDIGNIALDAGRDKEADMAFRRARELYEQHVATDPTAAQSRMQFGRVLGDIGLLHFRRGEIKQAHAVLSQSHEVLKRLVTTSPNVTIFRADLGHAAVRLALVTGHDGDRTVARELAKSGVELLSSIPSPSARYTAYQAKAHAVLGLMMADDSGQRSHSRESEACFEKSIGLLRKAIERGYRNLREYRRDPSFDPIRSLAEFEALMQDLSFPVEPFARATQ